MAEGGDLTSTKDGSDADFVYTCSPCGEDNEREEAVKFCPVCEEYLCSACTRHHGRQKATRSHDLIDCDASISSRPKYYKQDREGKAAFNERSPHPTQQQASAKLEVPTEMEIPDDVRQGLEKAFLGQDDDFLGRAIWFLSDSIANGCGEPYIRALKSVPNPVVFKIVAQRMVEDSKKAEKDKRYHQFMYDVWDNFLKDKLTECPDGGQKLALAIRRGQTFSIAQFCFLQAVADLPPESYMKLASAVSTVSQNGGNVLDIAHNYIPVVSVALLVVTLAWDVIKNIRRWWNGEISGKRCAKNIVDFGVGVAAGIGVGIGGETIGASVGSIFGPAGAAIGAVVGVVAGGIIGCTTAESLCDRLTQWVFGLPKSEALENAYSFLGTSSKASNSVINSQYRRLALKYHPDKGGEAGKWTRLQYSMAVIREARGEP